MANGTQQDPYVVKNWEEFSEYNTADMVGSYVQLSRSPYKSWDLAHSYPSGVNGGLTIYPNILGNGVEIINLCTKGGQFGVDFKGTVDNLKITTLYVFDAGCAVKFEQGAANVILSCEVGATNDLWVLNKEVYSDTSYTNCQFEFKCRNLSSAMRSIYLFHGNQSTKITTNNCEIYIDWDGFYGASFNVPLLLNASLIHGYINTPEYGTRFYDVKQVTTGDYPDSLIDLKINAPNIYYGSYSGDTSAKVFYNADEMPPFASGSAQNAWVGLTNAQIADETALNNAGFHTGDGTPWEYDDTTDPPLNQDDWVDVEKLGAFAKNGQLNHLNSSTRQAGLRICNIPANVQSVGRYSFVVNHLNEVYLPANCTYYSTTFGSISNIHGGQLIE